MPSCRMQYLIYPMPLFTAGAVRQILYIPELVINTSDTCTSLSECTLHYCDIVVDTVMFCFYFSTVSILPKSRPMSKYESPGSKNLWSIDEKRPAAMRYCQKHRRLKFLSCAISFFGCIQTPAMSRNVVSAEQTSKEPR